MNEYSLNCHGQVVIMTMPSIEDEKAMATWKTIKNIVKNSKNYCNQIKFYFSFKIRANKENTLGNIICRLCCKVKR